MFRMELAKTSITKLGRVKKEAINAGDVKSYRRSVHNVGRRIQRQFQRTTRTWTHNVQFKLVTRARQGDKMAYFEVSTNDRIWHWLDEGTWVRYRKSDPADPYVPKTAPGAFDSYPGGGSMISTGGIPFPGIQDRNWSEDERLDFIANFLLEDEFRKQTKKLRRITRG